MVTALSCEVGVLSVAIRVMLSLQEKFFSKLDSEKFNQWSVSSDLLNDCLLYLAIVRILLYFLMDFCLHLITACY